MAIVAVGRAGTTDRTLEDQTEIDGVPFVAAVCFDFDRVRSETR